MTAKQTLSANEDHVMQSKAPEQAYRWTLSGDCFVNCSTMNHRAQMNS